MSSHVASTPHDPLLAPTARHWWLWVLIGVLSIAAGVLALANPGLSLLAIALLFGCALIVSGLLDLLTAFTAEGVGTLGRVLSVLLGVLALVAGVICLRDPGASLLALVLVVGCYLIVAGALELVSAFGAEDRVAHALLGALDLALGVLILAIPSLSLVTFAVLFGIVLIVRGAMDIIGGVRMRRVAHEHAPPRHAAAVSP